MRFRLFLLLGVCAAAACSTTLRPEPLPAFPAYLPEKPGEDRIYLLAAGFGTLARRGRCLGLSSRGGGHFATIIWPPTASLGRDRRGLFVTDSESGAKLRLGDRFVFGGGHTFEQIEGRIGLTEPVPAERRAGRVAPINPGFRKIRRWRDAFKARPPNK